MIGQSFRRWLTRRRINHLHTHIADLYSIIEDESRRKAQADEAIDRARKIIANNTRKAVELECTL